MRAACFVAALWLTAWVGCASAQELAFGSETWRGHAVAIKDAPMSCRAFSFFGNGDRLVFVAFVPKGESQIVLMAFLSPASLSTGGEPSATSVGPVLDSLVRMPGASVRAWVDDDGGDGVQGAINGKSLSFLVGPLDKPAPAKFFQAVRDGNVLHVSVAGQDRRYVLRGTFAALSELVGCALKARDGEVMPSDGMPPHATIAMAPTPPPAPPPVTPVPVQPVAASVPPPVRPMRREVESSGSGIVVTAEGHVLTNNHVVDGCGSFGLRRVGEEERRATLLAKDSKNDLAVLRAERPYEDVVSFRVEPPRLAESVIVYRRRQTRSGSATICLPLVSASDYRPHHGVRDAE